jgi:tRNA(fMet)-specific endonuclease VapC
LPFEEPAARWFAKERARLSKIGVIVPMSDGEIAAVSAINQLTLITRNVSDFKHYDGLMIKNWFAPLP